LPDTALLTVLTSAGVAGVFCILFICGLLYPKSVVDDLRGERDALTAQLRAERDRADSAVAAAQATRDVLSALQAGVTLGHQHHEERPGVRTGGQPALGGEL
jgi:hypothetical protein